MRLISSISSFSGTSFLTSTSRSSCWSLITRRSRVLIWFRWLESSTRWAWSCWGGSAIRSSATSPKHMHFVCFVSFLKNSSNFRISMNSSTVCGISMFCIPLATSSYSALLTLCAIFGVTFASSFSFTPIITSRLVEMDDFTLAYGLILLVQGVGSLVGPPLAGFIFDLTDRWVFIRQNLF